MTEQTDAAEVGLDKVVDWLGAMPESRNVFDYTGEATPCIKATTCINIDVETLAARIAAREAAAEARGAERALREAADDWESDDTDPTPRTGSRADGWLRLRADRIAAQVAPSRVPGEES